jgi:short subunit dehydrogenase-like uncharacterized protein
MPDILLFGATGYTGRLTAEALARKGASFAIAGRNKSKLYDLADETNGPEVRVASVGDVDSLVAALDGVKVMITCVGPFMELGDTAVEAALRSKVHYIDSTGEGTFVAKLLERDGDAKEAGIVMAPCMGFDEVPADVAATLATEGMERADLKLTYSIPQSASRGTLKSALKIISAEGQWIRDGRPVMIRAGHERRWAPMPPPLGPKPAVAFPLAEGRLAPLHLDLGSLSIYATIGTAQRLGIQYAVPVLGKVLNTSWGQKLLEKAIQPLPEGPNETQRRRKWTVLAEASSGSEWRNVAVMGPDVYGLTAELLSAAALRMTADDFEESGVKAPVSAVGLDTLQKELIANDVSIDTYETRR